MTKIMKILIHEKEGGGGERNIPHFILKFLFSTFNMFLKKKGGGHFIDDVYFRRMFDTYKVGGPEPPPPQLRD